MTGLSQRTRFEIPPRHRPPLLKRRPPAVVIDPAQRCVELENAARVSRYRDWFIPQRVPSVQVPFGDLRAVRISYVRHRPELRLCMIQTLDCIYQLCISHAFADTIAGLQAVVDENPPIAPRDHVDRRLRRLALGMIAAFVGFVVVVVVVGALIAMWTQPTPPP